MLPAKKERQIIGLVRRDFMIYDLASTIDVNMRRVWEVYQFRGQKKRARSKLDCEVFSCLLHSINFGTEYQIYFATHGFSRGCL